MILSLTMCLLPVQYVADNMKDQMKQDREGRPTSEDVIGNTTRKGILPQSIILAPLGPGLPGLMAH